MTNEEDKKKSHEKCKCVCACICIIAILIVPIAISINIECKISDMVDCKLKNELHILLLYLALIVALITTIICATYLISKIIKGCYASKEETFSALNEAYDKIFGRDYSCEYKCWEKHNTNLNCHCTTVRKTVSASKPNNARRIPTGASQQQGDTKKTPNKDAQMKTPTNITNVETKGENSTASKES